MLNEINKSKSIGICNVSIFNTINTMSLKTVSYDWIKQI